MSVYELHGGRPRGSNDGGGGGWKRSVGLHRFVIVGLVALTGYLGYLQLFDKASTSSTTTTGRQTGDDTANFRYADASATVNDNVKVRRVIHVVTDGMGSAHYSLARVAKQHKKFAKPDTEPYSTLADAAITDIPKMVADDMIRGLSHTSSYDSWLSTLRRGAFVGCMAFCWQCYCHSQLAFTTIQTYQSSKHSCLLVCARAIHRSHSQRYKHTKASNAHAC
jgi:alkaline phosphatase